MMASGISFEERMEARKAEQFARLDKLNNIGVMMILLATLWMMIPKVMASMAGTSALLPELGPALLMLTWAFFIQDLMNDGALTNSRVGGVTAVFWLPLMVIGTWTINDSLGPMIGGFGCMGIAYLLYRESRQRLKAGWETIRYRAVMGGLGLVMSLSLFVVEPPVGSILLLNIGLVGVGLYLVISDSIGGDDKRELRKEFKKRLDQAQTRLLQLKSEGIVVDQASSLITTAGEEGHIDPHLGIKLIHEALDDIERTLAMSEDVEAIKNDAYAAVEKAENIAPTVARPRSALVQGDREVELGSLREGEMLYRQAKIRAGKVIEWWAKAEKAIIKAKNLVSGLDGEQSLHLKAILKESQEKLDAENPKLAYEFAITIPEQGEAIGEAVENAEEAVNEAERILKGADGLDTSLWEERMSAASTALSKGNHALARGLSDSVVREISSEREAMEDVRRARRQKKKLSVKWEKRPDAKEWQARWDELSSAADEKQWSHAATLLKRVVDDLDSETESSEEAEELLQFVKDEWRILRNQLEASGIKVDDEQRRECEASIGDAETAHGLSDWQGCLEALGKADDLMERLRRRV